MEENEISGLLDEAIKEALVQLKLLNKGTPEYNSMVANIAKLNEQRMAEARLCAETSGKAFDRAIEDEKMTHERELKLEETKQTKIKVWADVAKTGLSLIGTIGVSLIIMSYEEFAPIVSKAFQFVPKPKF